MDKQSYALTQDAMTPRLSIFSLGILISLTTAGSADPGDVVINEIMYKPRVQQFYDLLDSLKGLPWWESGDHPEAEYIELLNTGPTPVDLSGWSFSEGVEFEFPVGTTLEAGAYLVVCSSAETLTSEYGIDNAIGDMDGILSNDGERLTLVDNSVPPVVIDTVRYLDAPPWPLSPDQEGRSLECMDPGEDNARPENWRACRRLEIMVEDVPGLAVHGARRRVLGGTPGAANTVSTTEGLPPFVRNFTHDPIRPSSLDPVTISARITADAEIADVVLHYEFYREPFPHQGPVSTGTLGMTLREGSSYEAQIAPQASRTLVRYRVEATDVEGRAWTYPDDEELSVHRAYWSYDGEQDGTIPTYFLIFSQSEFDRLESDVFSKDTVEATVIADGIVYDHIQTRYRGCRGCPKRSYKIKFNRHEHLRDMNRLDLNADWPVAEKIGYDMFWFIGSRNLGTELVRLVRNGSFAGVLLALDSPNGLWAERRGLSKDIELYKAREGGILSGVPGRFAPSLTYYPGQDSIYPRIYIKRGDSLGSFQKLIDFTRDLDNLTGPTAAPYFSQSIETDSWMKKITVQMANAYCDFHVKNYYVFRTPDPGANWNILFFDIDGYWGQTMTGRTCPGCERLNPFCSGNVVNALALGNTEVRNRLHYFIREATLDLLTEDRILTHVDKLYDLTAEDRALENSTLQGPLVAVDESVDNMKEFFRARRDYLMFFIGNFPIDDSDNFAPTIRLSDPVAFDDAPGAPVRIEWEHDDVENDPASVDLYWTDLDWSYLQPIVTGWPASTGSYGWNDGVPVTDKDIYIHAVIRDPHSEFVSRATAGPVTLFDDNAPANVIPTIEPLGGEFSGEQEVTLDIPENAVIYYTLDGTDPRVSSTRQRYTGPFRIASSVIVRSVAVLEGTSTGWNAGDDWSDADNPNGPWTYADADGNAITERQTSWLELGPAWARTPDDGPGWALSQETHLDPDIPQGVVYTLGGSILRWTSPISGDIEIDGGLWIAFDRRRKTNWSLSHNGEVFTARSEISRTLARSGRPFLFEFGDGGRDALRRTVEIGDVIELTLWTDRTHETTAIDLQIWMGTPDLVGAVSEASFTSTGGGLETLRISEIMYQGGQTPDFDFIEVQNTGNSTLDLFGVRFADGVSFQFGSGRVLEPGEFAVVVANAAAFEALYPDVRIDGTYTGALDNGGERLTLSDRDGNELLQVDYDDEGLWPIAADGFGHSLVLRDPRDDGSLAEHWRASAQARGSPGAADPAPQHDGVWIHEVLTRGTDVTEDAIELFNATTAPIDVSGWFLSDDRSNTATLKKFEIPTGTVIAPRSYETLFEYQFNAVPGTDGSFPLLASGGAVYLSSANGAGELTGSIVTLDFAASDGKTFGLHRTSYGLRNVTLSAPSFGVDMPSDLIEFRTGTGAPNTLPSVGPVVLHEIRYHPEDAEGEFVEIRNLSESPVLFHNPDLGAGWRIDGIRGAGGVGDFEFPDGAMIDTGSYALVVDMDPDLFRVRHDVPEDVPVYGPFGGNLDNDGERIRLLAPTDTPDAFDVSFAVVDTVHYDVDGAWPIVRPGASLERIYANVFGDDPINWIESTQLGGTPGGPNSAEGSGENIDPIARFYYQLNDGGRTVVLDALPSTDIDGRIVSYAWQVGDDLVGSEQWIEHQVSTGETSVMLTVTDDDGATASATQTITISDQPSSLPGDANSDGRLDLSDAVRLLLLVFDPADRSLPCLGANVNDSGNVVLLDFDSNDNVGTNDALGLLRYLFLTGPAHARGTSCIEVLGCSEACP